jgi:hypothetical protein
MVFNVQAQRGSSPTRISVSSFLWSDSSFSGWLDFVDLDDLARVRWWTVVAMNRYELRDSEAQRSLRTATEG